MPHRAYYLQTSEISEKYLALVITDNLGEIQASDYSMTFQQLGNTRLALTADFIHQFIAQHPDFSLTAIGVGLPEHVDFDLSPIFNQQSALAESQSRKELAQAFSLPVYFDNKSHCLTLFKDFMAKMTKNDHNFIVFHVANIVLYVSKGQIYGRQNFLIGEIGHHVLNPQGKLHLW